MTDRVNLHVTYSTQEGSRGLVVGGLRHPDAVALMALVDGNPRVAQTAITIAGRVGSLALPATVERIRA